jgi:SAM-dependent methyltransferase
MGRRRSSAAAIEAPPGARLVLHVGCGPLDHYTLHERFRGPEWHEVRLDIDPGVRPDILASISDMSPVASASYDAVFSHHNIEHVFAHEVPGVMAEFLRVLRPGGEALISTPDLQAVAAEIAKGRLHERLYRAEVGDISALDIVYGLQSDIEGGREYMAHRTGFTIRTLGVALKRAGFVGIEAVRGPDYALWARGRRPAA